MTERDRLQALIDAAAEDETRREAQASAPRTRSRAVSLWSAFSISLLALGAGWLIFRNQIQEPAARELEAGRKIAMSIAAETVRGFVRRNGRYPDELGELIPADLDVRYRKLDDGFELTTTLPDGKKLTVKQQ